MPRYLNPRSDLVFKKIFGEHKRILKSFLNAILPLEPSQKIVSLDYLSAEQAPVIPELKRPIVDVKCTDQEGRIFIVEMQIEWVTEFMQRMLFNTSTAYVKQLPKGSDYHLLQPVYGLALLAEDFDTTGNQWYHHYKIVNIENTQKTIEGLQLIFIELKKFKTHRRVEKTLQTLWLRFMSEIDEHTLTLPDEMLSVQEIGEAASLSEEAGYTPAELSYYDAYWDSVSTEKTLISGKYAEGKAEGKAEGRAEEKMENARVMLQENISEETVKKVTGLSLEILQSIQSSN